MKYYEIESLVQGRRLKFDTLDDATDMAEKIAGRTLQDVDIYECSKRKIATVPGDL